MASSHSGKASSVRFVRWSRFWLALLSLSSCSRSQPAPAPSVAPVDSVSAARQRLASFEAEQRRGTDFLRLPPASISHGPDPYALARLDARHSLGVLRGASALVLLDDALHELSRLALNGAPVSVCVAESGEIWVVGEESNRVQRFRFDGRALAPNGGFEVPGVLGFRAIAGGSGDRLFALDGRAGRLFALDGKSGRVLESRDVGHGALALKRVGSSLIVNALLDHTLVVYRLGSTLEERARIRHDGPIWGFDAVALPGDELLVVATGVEDHPLDRSDGSFGYIDSFAFAYLIRSREPAIELWRTNVSERGVVTPKAPLLAIAEGRARVFIAGYGSDRAVELFFDVLVQGPPVAQSEPFFPGVSAALRLSSGDMAFADPLLDAWILRPETERREVLAELRPVEPGATQMAPTEERLGEALFFTTLMSPHNSSEGSRSRFTCETCHFEGYVDGRVHYTGRGDVRVSTKPLRGLFNNRPHFSRALDEDLATVSHHEFRVAGKGSGKDPWFALERSDYPWLEQLGVRESHLEPEPLRRALITFLMRFSHTTNPAVAGRSSFDDAEREGAGLFRERCASCHAPRVQSDVPESALSFDAWQSAIFSREGALVWASADYRMTGVTPYVHERGTRVPSLRRLYAKWPHFTNGSAATLLDVVSRARFDPTRFFHDHAPADPGMVGFTPAQARSVVAFLELL